MTYQDKSRFPSPHHALDISSKGIKAGPNCTRGPMPIEAILFDCDGVLIDSETISANVLIAALGEHGVHVDLDHCYNHFTGRSFPTVAKGIREHFSVALPQTFEQTYRSRLLDAFGESLKPTHGVTDLLSSLTLPICVATSSSPRRAARSLALAGLDHFFGSLLFTASQVENGKPAPDLFLFAADQLGVTPANCLVIEDSLPGVRAGLAAEMHVLRYTGGSHLKGRRVESIEQVPVFDDWAQLHDLMPELAAGTSG